MNLNGRHIVLGITGSIAAYKIAGLASLLQKQGADITVIMTANATNFINPITFETLTGNKCLIDTFDRNFQYSVEHVALAKKAEVFLVAPASANFIAKAAMGIADDMLTTTFLACNCPKIIAPAMNTQMYLNPVTQRNLGMLSDLGMEIITPASGHLACGDTGAGKMPEIDILYAYLEKALAPKDLTGLKVVVSAGPTREAIDPVRYITNHSSGKMGYAIAKAAARRGADVTLVSGPVDIKAPEYVRTIPIISAADMAKAVKESAADADIVIKAAAVADYRPANVAKDKIKKKDGDLNVPLSRTEDIIGFLGEHKKPAQFLCGFSMETRDLIENSKAKLSKKNLDMIVANNVKVEGAGFAGDTNVVTFITPEDLVGLPIMTKDEVADELLSFILKKMNR
ncbi:MAG: bifunctional phosphopantothenoylcysteine decarboxylase/phosphopantothenate--cysteine ligase CoaBC [Clostridiales bacterium]|nr:bifunctional phosphopantothenoylcysteine decarboxylase/phosphopantothenate--cysteine ligase CoaBC [Clostridiales bacterium]